MGRIKLRLDNVDVGMNSLEGGLQWIEAIVLQILEKLEGDGG